MGQGRLRTEYSGVGRSPHELVTTVMKLAWELHKKNPHEGICWGPTVEEIKQARERYEKRKSGKQGANVPATVEAASAGRAS